MKLKLRLIDVKKVKYIYPEIDIQTRDYPELEGKTLDGMRVFIEQHAHTMAPTDPKYNTLLDQFRADMTVVVLQHYPEESEFFVEAEDEKEEYLPKP